MIDFLFNPSGRISRKGYLMAYLPAWLILTQIVAPYAGFLGTVIGLAFLWPGFFAVPIKRFHDMGLSGWYHIAVLGLLFFAFVALSFAIGETFEDKGLSLEQMTELSQAELMTHLREAFENSSQSVMWFLILFGVVIAEFLLIAVRPGQTGANRYGNDPLADGRGFAD